MFCNHSFWGRGTAISLLVCFGVASHSDCNAAGLGGLGGSAGGGHVGASASVGGASASVGASSRGAAASVGASGSGVSAGAGVSGNRGNAGANAGAGASVGGLGASGAGRGTVGTQGASIGATTTSTRTGSLGVDPSGAAYNGLGTDELGTPDETSGELTSPGAQESSLADDDPIFRGSASENIESLAFGERECRAERACLQFVPRHLTSFASGARSVVANRRLGVWEPNIRAAVRVKATIPKQTHKRQQGTPTLSPPIPDVPIESGRSRADKAEMILAWRWPSRAPSAKFFVELRDVHARSGGGEVFSGFAKSPLVVKLPRTDSEYAWRVYAVSIEQRRYSASDWKQFGVRPENLMIGSH